MATVHTRRLAGWAVLSWGRDCSWAARRHGDAAGGGAGRNGRLRRLEPEFTLQAPPATEREGDGNSSAVDLGHGITVVVREFEEWDNRVGALLAALADDDGGGGRSAAAVAQPGARSAGAPPPVGVVVVADARLP